MTPTNINAKSLESWIWDAACSIRGAKDAPKYKDYILPLIFTKRLCDVFDDELNRIAAEVGSRKKAFQLAKADHKLVRFYLPLVPDDPEQPVWSVIRKLSDKIGEGVTTHMRAIARENPLLQGIIDRVDFNATTHGRPKSTEAQVLGRKLLRSGTSVGANYREAHRGRSKAEFIAKCGGSLRELEESAYWLELLVEGGIVTAAKLYPLSAECDELTAIFVTIVKNARKKPVTRLPPSSFFLQTSLAASRGSGNAGMNKEKSVRRWFVDQDPIRSDLVNFMFNVLVLNVTDQIFQSWPISVRLWFFDNNKNASKPGDATSLEFAWLA